MRSLSSVEVEWAGSGEWDGVRVRENGEKGKVVGGIPFPAKAKMIHTAPNNS